MRTPLSIIVAAVFTAGTVFAQNAAQSGGNSKAFLQSDWLKTTSPGETIKTSTGSAVTDPFVVLSTGVLWQDKYDAVYTRQVDNSFSLSCEANRVALGDDFEQLSRGERVGFQFQPDSELTLSGNLDGATTDALIPADSTTTSGASLSATTHLATQSELTLGLRSDRTTTDVPAGLETSTNAYDAQFKQPIGKLPLSAIFKGHYKDNFNGHASAGSLPSLEQSLQWKPLQDTTLQMGLRQQQYQEYPGVDHQLNQALFAEWSQQVIDNVSWHSYAEVLNSKGLIDHAPASPIASGANGTPQATTPGSNANLTSSLPVSIDDQTLTFSTGPSIKVQQDISASVEYSNRWDKNPAPGSVGQEQRVSVSVKGTF